MMVLKSIGVFSAGKIMGVMYALFGLIGGALITLFALAGLAGRQQGGPEAMMFGAGAIIFLPLIYGVAGFIGGIISAAIYNIVAAISGGLELEFEATGRLAAEEDDYE